MTYHDKNRLTAHTAHLKLTATQLAVAKELADSLKLKNGSIQLPASYLAKQIGRTDKTTQLAIKALLELGIFTATRATSHTARTYELAISCPDSCLHLEAHNSPIRLKRLAIRSKEAQLTGNLDTQEAQLTGNLDQLTGNHYLTNRDRYIDDIELQLSKTIFTISELLDDLGELTKYQLKLKTWITSNPESVEARVRHLAGHYKVENLRPWLASIISNSKNPKNAETLYRHLEQETKTSKQAIKQQKQTATIYSELPGSNRLSIPRLERWVLEQAGFTMTAISSKYLLKRGEANTWRDLELCKYFEQLASHPAITAIDPNQHLQLELIDNQIVASYLDPDSSRFDFDLDQINAWEILTPSELSNHLEAEKLELELVENYLEANPGKTRPKALFDLQPQLAEIRDNYPRISPQEASRRYTQGFSKFLNDFYQGLPEQPINQPAIEPLTTWLPSNYTQEHDYQELLAEHYPEQPQGQSWNYQAGLNAYLEANNQGITWGKLASLGDRYIASKGDTWAKHPATWINEQLERHNQAKARPASRAGEATNLGEILASFTRP